MLNLDRLDNAGARDLSANRFVVKEYSLLPFGEASVEASVEACGRIRELTIVDTGGISSAALLLALLQRLPNLRAISLQCDIWSSSALECALVDFAFASNPQLTSITLGGQTPSTFLTNLPPRLSGRLTYLELGGDFYPNAVTAAVRKMTTLEELVVQCVPGRAAGFRGQELQALLDALPPSVRHCTVRSLAYSSPGPSFDMTCDLERGKLRRLVLADRLGSGRAGAVPGERLSSFLETVIVPSRVLDSTLPYLELEASLPDLNQVSGPPGASGTVLTPGAVSLLARCDEKRLRSLRVCAGSSNRTIADFAKQLSMPGRLDWSLGPDSCVSVRLARSLTLRAAAAEAGVGGSAGAVADPSGGGGGAGSGAGASAGGGAAAVSGGAAGISAGGGAGAIAAVRGGGGGGGAGAGAGAVASASGGGGASADAGGGSGAGARAGALAEGSAGGGGGGDGGGGAGSGAEASTGGGATGIASGDVGASAGGGAGAIAGASGGAGGGAGSGARASAGGGAGDRGGASAGAVAKESVGGGGGGSADGGGGAGVSADGGGAAANAGAHGARGAAAAASGGASSGDSADGADGARAGGNIRGRGAGANAGASVGASAGGGPGARAEGGAQVISSAASAQDSSPGWGGPSEAVSPLSAAPLELLVGRAVGRIRASAAPSARASGPALQLRCTRKAPGGDEQVPSSSAEELRAWAEGVVAEARRGAGPEGAERPSPVLAFQALPSVHAVLLECRSGAAAREVAEAAEWLWSLHAAKAAVAAAEAAAEANAGSGSQPAAAEEGADAQVEEADARSEDMQMAEVDGESPDLQMAEAAAEADAEVQEPAAPEEGADQQVPAPDGGPEMQQAAAAADAGADQQPAAPDEGAEVQMAAPGGGPDLQQAAAAAADTGADQQAAAAGAGADQQAAAAGAGADQQPVAAGVASALQPQKADLQPGDERAGAALGLAAVADSSGSVLKPAAAAAESGGDPQPEAPDVGVAQEPAAAADGASLQRPAAAAVRNAPSVDGAAGAEPTAGQAAAITDAGVSSCWAVDTVFCRLTVLEAIGQVLEALWSGEEEGGPSPAWDEHRRLAWMLGSLRELEALPARVAVKAAAVGGAV
ncbi:hypothetical protein HYH03_010133 [Edaphochlamys debaryana]|uniref:Uncharacterized protein n=1 Tax=Edaphochlamys debaryana TaxID=47281 RepID=A0A835XX96_9CHLO|nr:hypothetical protein HYH03_010133 [Edaphochlamys debaryana]|eukprot:KAG2491565.1 hypothetical protein HYH03_010133 [Edaphochlamys debaryana]